MGQTRLAVFCSGQGTNLQAILSAIQTGQISATIGIVLSDNPSAYCLTRAEQGGIPTTILNWEKYPSGIERDQEILAALTSHSVDWIILAGFMRLLGPPIVGAYRNRILNIHPALLPSFKGINAIQRAFEYGVKVTGVTVHIVDEGTDSGPIILQEAVQILPTDTLESLTEKIHSVERRLYPKAIQLAVLGKLRIEGRQVRILE